ncbi:nitrogen regulatory protein PII [Alishewanella agri BL06]|uniref:Nitrogen regulatory protein PII n=1 Tax=Alishewanella agri BL06 TaxID=1195246 RepID=I8UBE6_9ALTE|nr:hypothetical protein [Alishewanella agri]EIW89263.1 nitrogen regulatory protein PII [Alishewanella agri BL06]
MKLSVTALPQYNWIPGWKAIKRPITHSGELVRVGGLDEKLDTGIAIMLDVEKALGLTEHIKKLEQQKPLDA